MNEKSLIEARNQLLDRIQNLAEKQSSVQGLFLGGSLAAGNPDAYSDIDFRIVLAPTVDKEQFLKMFLKKVAPILFIETQTSFYAVVHFASFIKLDVFVYYPEELQPSPWFANIWILKEEQHQLHELKVASHQQSYLPTQTELDFFLTKYYANLHEYYRRLQRQETIYATTCRLVTIHCLISFWYMEKGYPPNSLGDWSKYEGPRTKLTTAQQHIIQDLLSAESKFIHQIDEQVQITLLNLTAQPSLTVDFAHYQQVVSLIK